MRSQQVVLVPHYTHIEPDTEHCLRAVERLGVEVVRRPGCSDIGFARSEMISESLIGGKESMLFIDADMVFIPGDAIRLLDRTEPVVGGLYPQKFFNHKLVAQFDPSVTEIPIGKEGRDFRVSAVGAGFLRIRRQTLLDLIELERMPECTFHGGRFWPFFLQRVEEQDDLRWSYQSEDFAFCCRCVKHDIPVIVDTTIRLGHLGKYMYTLEDAMRDPPVFRDSFVIPHRSV